MFYLFVIFFLYSFVFHWYPYVFPWPATDQPGAPLPILLSRDVLFLGLVFVYILQVIKNGFKVEGLAWPPLASVMVCFVLLIIVLFFGIFHTNPADFLQHNLRNLIMYFLMIPIFFHIARNSDDSLLTRMSQSFVIFGALLSLFGLYTFIAMDKSILWGGMRVYSLMGNPNTFGLFLIIPALIAWSMILGDNPRRLKIILSLALFLDIAALVLTISFQSVLSFFVAMAIMTVLIKRWRAVFALAGMAVICVIAGWIIVHYYEAFIQAFFIKLESPEATSYTGRIDQFHFVVDTLSHISNWFAGDFDVKTYMRFDSQYYNIIVNNGIFAFILYLIAPVYVMLIGLQYRGRIRTGVSSWAYSLYIAGIVFLATMLSLTANLTAFMQRYPINMYYYLLIGIVLYMIYAHGESRPSSRRHKTAQGKIPPGKSE